MHDGVLTSVMKSYIFQVSLVIFSRIFVDFSIPLIILKTFQGPENFNFKFHDFQTFPGFYEPCVCLSQVGVLLKW